MRYAFFRWISLALAGLAGQAAAETPADLQFHGFVAQALIHTSANNFFGDTDGHVDTGFTELGVNGSWRVNPHLQLSAQLLSRRAGESDDGDPRLDYGFANLHARLAENVDGGILLGRSKTPYGLYNETRDVTFTRPSILLPQSIYFDRTRNLALSFTGAQAWSEIEGDAGTLSLRLGYGDLDLSGSSIELALFGRNQPGEFRNAGSAIARVIAATRDERWRIGLTIAKLRLDYAPGLGDPLGKGRNSLEPLILSVQHNDERWTFTAEAAQRRLKNSNFAVPQANGAQVGESGYVQAAYRFVPRWEGIVRYDVYYADRTDRDGSRYAAASPATRVAHSRFARDWTIGARWDPTNALMLRLEFHHVDGTGWLPREDNPDILATERRWNMWLFQAAYRF